MTAAVLFSFLRTQRSKPGPQDQASITISGFFFAYGHPYMYS